MLLGIVITIACVFFVYYSKATVGMVAPILIVYILYVGFPSKRFTATEHELKITGLSYLFRKPLSILYDDILEVHCHFTDQRGSVNTIKFSTKAGKTISIIHKMSRKKLNPILAVLSQQGIPMTIHDVDNDDLL